MKLLRKTVTYDEVDLSSNDVITLKEAAEKLGMTFQGISSAIDRGQFTELVNQESESSRHQRRLMLRSEVEHRAAEMGNGG